MKTVILILLLCLAPPNPTLAEALKYDTVVTLAGTLVTATGETPDGDPVEFPALKLTQHIDVDENPDDMYAAAERGVEQLQLLLSDEWVKEFNAMKGREVVLTGTLFHSFTGHHHTRVLMDVKDVKPSPDPGADTTTAASTNTGSSSGADGKSGMKFGLVVTAALFVNLLACLVLHSNGTLTIYRDYTDAALTFAGIVFPLAVLLACSLAELQQALTGTLTALAALVSLFFIFRSTYVHNSSLLLVIMALLAKIFVISLYILFIFGNKGAGSRRDGESDVAYEIRRTHEDLKSAIFMAIYTALFLMLTRAMTRYRYFAPLHEHVSLSFRKMPLDQVQLSGEAG